MNIYYIHDRELLETIFPILTYTNELQTLFENAVLECTFQIMNVVIIKEKLDSQAKLDSINEIYRVRKLTYTKYISERNAKYQQFVQSARVLTELIHERIKF